MFQYLHMAAMDENSFPKWSLHFVLLIVQNPSLVQFTALTLLSARAGFGLFFCRCFNSNGFFQVKVIEYRIDLNVLDSCK